jgi:dipeptidyl aminopeptidase/acylaminoacyl peptidase
MGKMMIRKFAFLWFIAVAICATGQEVVKKAITADDYQHWHTVGREIISNDGLKAAFEYNPQQGDGNLILKYLQTGTGDTIQRGTKAAFDSESRFLVFHIHPPRDSVKKAKRKEVKKEDMPTDSLGILLFEGRKFFKFPDVKSYAIPEETTEWIAFLVKQEEKKDTVSTVNRKPAKKSQGGDLILFHVPSADSLIFRNVSGYRFARKGSNLFIVQEWSDSAYTTSKAFVYNVLNKQNTPRYEGTGWIKNPAIDERGEKIAFLHSADTMEAKNYALLYGPSTGAEPQVIAENYSPGMPVGWSPSENGEVRFSQDGKKLFFGTAPVVRTEPKDTLLPEEKSVVDIWHWKDPILQSQQKSDLEKEKKRSYLAVYHTDINRFVQLADLNIREIRTVNRNNGDQALGFDATPYQWSSGWTGSRTTDTYLVDLRSGIKRMMVTGKNFSELSPGGKFIVWYEEADSSWYARSTDLASTKAVQLTKIIPVRFCDEKHDTPAPPSPYGIAGWAPDDRFVYLYDRYDIWRIDPAGERVPVSVTQAFGRRNQIRFRYIKTNDEEVFIPSEANMLVSAFNEISMESGFYAADFSSFKEPRKLITGQYFYSFSARAKSSDALLWKRENVTEYPDIWTSGLNFDNPVRISHANPQQSEFNWATSELVEWDSFSGEKLKGILHKPENFNPSKKYPMIIYFYEVLSETLYRHHLPSPSRSTINRTMYASNGYLVFVPDIRYTTGYPGQSAYDAIVSGANHLISIYPFVDKDRIGLQGQSWGGYQTAWLITRTNMFAAAMAGAPVSNMTSAYGGIRWETGFSRMFQYEQTQSRIGGNLWEKPLHYIENSPLFYVPKIETPLLMMHNDNDGAVPWYQGIEMFVAMRRLNKPVWMLNYNNEPHNLKAESWANRIDLDKRMFQFFNHYLKGIPMPEWMEYGIPAIDKGKKPGY